MFITTRTIQLEGTLKGESRVLIEYVAVRHEGTPETLEEPEELTSFDVTIMQIDLIDQSCVGVMKRINISELYTEHDELEQIIAQELFDAEHGEG